VTGTRLVARSEDRKWRLGVKLDLYRDLARAVEDLRSTLLESIKPEGLIGKQWIEDSPVESRYADAMTRVFSGMTDATIIAEPEVYDALRRFLVDVVTVVDGPEDEDNLPLSFLAAFELLSRSSEAVTDAMRSDLGFRRPQLHVGWREKERWRLAKLLTRS
jgi:hypothetical protein